jgi:hypothetical protein
MSVGFTALAVVKINALALHFTTPRPRVAGEPGGLKGGKFAEWTGVLKKNNELRIL